ncbi:atherin-like [Hyaena hyaena]|uniref:atherin-like n=1 Tax=Hyaena hyaena TaxID=95912 RepID=UPI001924F8E8|nr:atherin-like [Hyaena hyaena]
MVIPIILQILAEAPPQIPRHTVPQLHTHFPPPALRDRGFLSSYLPLPTSEYTQRVLRLRERGGPRPVARRLGSGESEQRLRGRGTDTHRSPRFGPKLRLERLLDARAPPPGTRRSPVLSDRATQALPRGGLSGERGTPGWRLPVRGRRSVWDVSRAARALPRPAGSLCAGTSQRARPSPGTCPRPCPQLSTPQPGPRDPAAPALLGPRPFGASPPSGASPPPRGPPAPPRTRTLTCGGAPLRRPGGRPERPRRRRRRRRRRLRRGRGLGLRVRSAPPARGRAGPGAGAARRGAGAGAGAGSARRGAPAARRTVGPLAARAAFARAHSTRPFLATTAGRRLRNGPISQSEQSSERCPRGDVWEEHEVRDSGARLPSPGRCVSPAALWSGRFLSSKLLFLMTLLKKK